MVQVPVLEFQWEYLLAQEHKNCRVDAAHELYECLNQCNKDKNFVNVLLTNLT